MVDGCVTYSIDDCRTRFFDLLQMVEFYQLNRGSLSTRLTHYIVSLESAPDKDTICEKKVSSGDNRDVQNNEKIFEITQVVECIHENGASELSARKNNAPVDLPTPSPLSIRQVLLHNNLYLPRAIIILSKTQDPFISYQNIC